MDASLYAPVFLYSTSLVSILLAIQYITSPDYHLQEEKKTILVPIILSIILTLWLGNRPINGYYFVDTSNYALIYKLHTNSIVNIDWNSEWIWEMIIIICKKLNLDIHAYFTIIEAGYIFSILWAVIRFMPTKSLLGMLFVITSLMFYSFGVNGIRNGLACHIILLGLSFLLDSKYIIGSLFCMIAFGIHKSTMLPIAAIIPAIIFKDKVKYAIYIWLLSIPLSLVAGGAAISFFSSLGFDDRMSSYTSANNDLTVFSSTGFRWDFLLYSSFPILMIWFVCVKRQIVDYWYNVLAIIYCLCNAFWVLVITAEYSNRFAYLSWFIYPIIIAYPLINLPVWEDQDRKTGFILLAYCGFTLFMELVFWG